MTMTEQFSADVQAVEAELPVSFVFKGKAYIGQKSATSSNREMGDPGFTQMFGFELFVRSAVLALMPSVPPAENDVIEIGAVRYRIESVTSSQDGVGVNYHMVQDT